MSTHLSEAPAATFSQAVVATYKNHSDAEAAVRLLAHDGVPVNTISIIGRDFESREDIQGFYRPGDAALTGAGEGAWFGGIFGLLFGAMGFFVLPIVGGLWILGPIAGFLAGGVAGAGIGALVSALIAAGIPKDQALKYQERLQAGEFLVVVHAGAGEVSQAREILASTGQLTLQSHDLDRR